MKKLLVLVAFLPVFLSACSQLGQSNDAEVDIIFNRGPVKFTCTGGKCQGMNGLPLVWEFRVSRIAKQHSGGIYLQTQDQNPNRISGNWRLDDGNRIYLSDNFCNDFGRQKNGAYYWDFDADKGILTFNLISDGCADRELIMSEPWYYVEESDEKESTDNSSFDVSGIWIFSGSLRSDVFPEDEMEKYNGWSIQVIQENNKIKGYDDNGNERIDGSIIGNSVEFYMHIDDDPSACGDFSNFVGTLQNNGSNKIVGTLTGHDCANNTWDSDGDFTIEIMR
ncbi:hypothetical protein ACFLXB_05120 [Chloroflexota bacterium]